MRRLLALPLPVLLLVAACNNHGPSPASSAAGDMPTIAAAAPASEVPQLGTPAWYAWVERRLDLDNPPPAGSPAWNRVVQERLGQEAPQDRPGSPAWQQAVDALLRTRLPAHGAG